MTGDVPDFLRDLSARLAEVAEVDEIVGEVERRVRQFCGEHGIPRSIFLGRAITERTTVTYRRDDDGNLVVSRITERDPEWLPEDVEAALRWLVERDALCPGCRQPRRESFDKSNRYTAERHTCQACAPMQRASWQADQNRPKNGAPQFGAYYSAKKLD